MMTKRDIVERLRWWALHNSEWVSIAPAAMEAADEIERLREALEDAGHDAASPSPYDGSFTVSDGGLPGYAEGDVVTVEMHGRTGQYKIARITPDEYGSFTYDLQIAP